MYSIVADVVLLAHVGFVAFVVLSVPVMWVGAARRKRFVHNRVFRLLHLAAMGLVLGQALLGVICPLTTWEMELRLKAGGGNVYVGSFLQHWLHKILFYETSPTVFTWIYGVFFCVVVATMVAIPPRWRSTATGCKQEPEQAVP